MEQTVITKADVLDIIEKILREQISIKITEDDVASVEAETKNNEEKPKKKSSRKEKTVEEEIEPEPGEEEEAVEEEIEPEEQPKKPSRKKKSDTPTNNKELSKYVRGVLAAKKVTPKQVKTLLVEYVDDGSNVAISAISEDLIPDFYNALVKLVDGE